MAFPFDAAQLLAATSTASGAPLRMDADAVANLPEAMRYLAANGPLFRGLPGLPPGIPLPGGLPPTIPGLPPGIPFPQIDFTAAGAGMPNLFPGLDFYPGFIPERRKNATREVTAPLKAWLLEHKKNPYPSKQEKILLAVMTKMTMTQVSTWFANARRRLKKEHKNEWSPRNRPVDDDDFDATDVNERPSSSLSDISGSGIGEKRKANSQDDDSESNNNANGDRSAAASPLSAHSEPLAKKPKIWSIAELSNESTDTKSSPEASEDEPKPATSPSVQTGPVANANSLMAVMQQHMAAMLQQVGVAAGPAPHPINLPQRGFRLPFASYVFNPVSFYQQQATSAAAAVAAMAAAQPQSSPQQMPNLSGSWSDNQSPSPAASNHSASDDAKQDVKPEVKQAAAVETV